MSECKSKLWKSVPGYEGVYEVGDMGDVRSLDRVDCRGSRRAGKVLVPFRDGDCGYVAVCLVNGGVSRRFKVHRLVATVWLKPTNGRCQVNHKNGDKRDNSVKNLEWCTGSENVRHSYDILGRRSSGGHEGKTGALHHCSRQVIATNITTGAVDLFGSTAEAARLLCIPSGSIPRCCSGKYKQSHGYTFRYAD